MDVRAVVIGVGSSGSRFIEAAHFVDSSVGKIHIVGIADIDERKLEALANAAIFLERDFRVLLNKVSVDIIIISTTDDTHYEVLKYIKDNNIFFRRIICEKPLVVTPAQMKFIECSFEDDQICVSFVERYSSAVSELTEFVKRKGRRVSKVNFDWSKYRIKDIRPTIGVSSEITHPLDLACYVAGVSNTEALRKVSSSICESDFAQGGALLPETLLACVDFSGGMVLTGVSSYIRSERRRTMEFLLSNESSYVTEIAVLRLDSPKWDDDYLDIFEIDSSCGQLSLIFSYANSLPDRSPRRQIDKICRFLEDVVGSIKGEYSPCLTNKTQALFVQSIVQRVLDGHVVERRIFSNDLPNRRCESEDRLRMLADLIKLGCSEDIWNDRNDQY